MKFQVALTVLISLVCIQATNAQMQLDLVCDFAMQIVTDVEPQYTCSLYNIEFDFTNPFYFIRITGEHLEGMEDDDVTFLRIFNSSMNTIPANIFNVLTNITAIEITESGSLTLLPVNFGFAQRVSYIRIVDNSIPVIFGVPFFLIGNTLESLELRGNGITTLGADVFFGLTNLTHLSLGDNNLSVLSPRLFAPLTSLRSVFVFNNLIEVLNNRMFSNNLMLETITFGGNRIESIGPNFLNPLENLRYLWLYSNNCTDLDFEIGEDLTRGDIRTALQGCMNNFIDPPVTGNNFFLTVHGNMTFLDENGYELLRVTN